MSVYPDIDSDEFHLFPRSFAGLYSNRYLEYGWKDVANHFGTPWGYVFRHLPPEISPFDPRLDRECFLVIFTGPFHHRLSAALKRCLQDMSWDGRVITPEDIGRLTGDEIMEIIARLNCSDLQIYRISTKKYWCTGTNAYKEKFNKDVEAIIPKNRAKIEKMLLSSPHWERRSIHSLPKPGQMVSFLFYISFYGNVTTKRATLRCCFRAFKMLKLPS